MSSRSVPALGATPPVGPDSPTGLDLRAHMLRLQAENETLEYELARCQEQLSFVLDVSGHISNAQDPEAIQRDVLARFAALLGARVLFMDRAGCCMQVDVGLTAADLAALTPDRVRAALARQIEVVRESRCALALKSTEPCVAALDGAQPLLGAFHRADAETGVVIALRDPSQPPFEAGDVAAAEAVLAYGAQVLGGVLTVRHLQRTALETVCTLVNAIDAKDNYTSDHSERVGGLARLIGQALGLSKARLQVLEWSGLLHDVGKIGVPERILNKPGTLTPPEFEDMKRHPRVGYDMLKPVAQFAPMLDAVLYHHENHDGSGYPEGLGGQRIPLDAQIIHVVDIFDALTTNRPYRESYAFEQALTVLEEGAGSVTEPGVTRLFVKTLRRLMAEQPGDFGEWLSQVIECGGPAGVACDVNYD